MNAGAISSWSLSWQFWAVLSAVFAALTAIFAKVGVENVNSDLATFIRTIIVVCVLAAIVAVTRQFQNPAESPGEPTCFCCSPGSAPERRGCATSGRSNSAMRRKSRQSTN
jgi:hypothetical protein